MTQASNAVNPLQSPAKYPTTTSEVAKMLGIEGSSQDLPMGTFSAGHNLPVANLPIVPDEHSSQLASSHTADHSSSAKHVEGNLHGGPVPSGFLNKAKAIAPYIAVFTVGLVLYYFFFTGFNFNSIFKSSPKPQTSKQTALSQLKSQNLASYQKWIAGFYYDVTNPKITDPDSDNSGNGLTNFQKYLLKLNPKSYDTLGTGIADSQALAQGIDPSTGFALTDSQKDIVNKYIDMEVAMNRLTLSRLQNPEAVAGIGINSQGFLLNNPATVPTQNYNQNSNIAPTTGANLVANGIEINTDIPGRLEVPDLKINVPVIWTKDTNNFEKDLQAGVVHYPGTALPGQIGTTYISGHSSNYVWAKGDFNSVFTKLGDLADNTSFKITVVQKNGKDAIFHYVVSHRKEYLPTDQEQFVNTGKSIVALSTCWPINSTAKRLVVFGILTQTEK